VFSVLGAVLLAAAVAASATAAEPPTVTTGAPTEVTPYSAVFHATVETHGEPTSVAFQYGSTTEYGDFTKYVTIAKGNYERIPVSTTVRDLTGSANFHVRAVAGVSSGGSVKNLAFGKDEAFTTTGGLYVTSSIELPLFHQSGANPLWAALTPETAELPGPEGPFALIKGSVEATCSGLLGSLAAPGGLPSSELTVNPTGLGYNWEGCQVNGMPASVKMNGCRFAYGATPGWAEAVGHVSIICKEPEAKIVVAAEGKYASQCTVEIPAQTLGGIVGYVNEALGGLSFLRVYTFASGLTASVTGSVCGTHTLTGASMGGELIFA